jgi:diaminobutyrate-2-oxoglutarate transaminase
VTATAALTFWEDERLQQAVVRKGQTVQRRLEKMAKKLVPDARVRGRGLIWGIEFSDTALATRVSQACFARGLIIETAGIDDQVLKILPSLTISEDELRHGLDVIEASLSAVLNGLDGAPDAEASALAEAA